MRYRTVLLQYIPVLEIQAAVDSLVQSHPRNYVARPTEAERYPTVFLFTT